MENSIQCPHEDNTSDFVNLEKLRDSSHRLYGTALQRARKKAGLKRSEINVEFTDVGSRIIDLKKISDKLRTDPIDFQKPSYYVKP